jgi:hypothetical protein
MTQQAQALARRSVRLARRLLKETGYALPLFLAIVAVVGAVALPLAALVPPTVVPATAPATEFSAERAMRTVEAVASERHPPGSAAHAAVETYLVEQLAALGLEPQVQAATGVAQAPEGGFASAAAVRNLVGRLAGTDNTRAVLLAAHYDSVPNSAGAADDAAGVAALLETARALRAGPPLRNDVVVLFTDGEELDLLGARAFVGEHPWANDVGLVLNFEARGTRGAVLMFETSAGNGRLVDGLARAVSAPVAYSFLVDIYRHMPNGTDFTVLRETAAGGLNFAFAENPSAYHTALDTAGTLDRRTLQHNGAYALSLTRAFGNADLAALGTAGGAGDGAGGGDAVFFTLAPGVLIRYTQAWALPLAVLAALLFAGLAVFGRHRRALRPGGLLLGVAGFLGSVAAVVVVATLAWLALQRLAPSYRAPATALTGATYHPFPLLLGFVALAAATMAGLYAWLGARLRPAEALAGALCGWLAAALLTARALPGASYLFAWPLLAGLAALAWTVSAGRSGEAGALTGRRRAALVAATLPALVLLAPALYLVFVMVGPSTMGVPLAGVEMGLVALMLGLLLPALPPATAGRRWLPAGAALVVCLGLLGAAVLTAGFDAAHPRPDAIQYRLDADAGRAAWVTVDERLDAYTSPFFPPGTARRPYRVSPALTLTEFRAPAPVVALAAPEVTALGDVTDASVRTLRLRVRSPRGAPNAAVDVQTPGQIVAAALDGHRLLPSRDRHSLAFSYAALPAEGVELTLTLAVAAAQPVQVRVTDRSDDVPAIDGPSLAPRPPSTLPSPFAPGGTVVTRSITIAPGGQR